MSSGPLTAIGGLRQHGGKKTCRVVYEDAGTRQYSGTAKRSAHNKSKDRGVDAVHGSCPQRPHKKL